MNRKNRIWNEAKRTIRENDRIQNVASRARNKLKGLSENSEHFQTLSAKILVLIRMVKAHVSGSYRSFSGKTLLLIVFALLYFVVPVDVIPDFIPALGFTDDVSIIYFVWKQIAEDVSSFVRWEQAELKSN